MPIIGVGRYVERVTDAPEPTNADLLAFMQTAFAQLTTEIAGVKADFGELKDTVAGLKADLAATDRKVDSVRTEMREGFAGLKVETTLLGRYVLDAQRAVSEHVNNPQAHPKAP